MASPEIEKKVEILPDKPGVYRFHDASGGVIYVGKAQSLRGRVRSYLQAPEALPPKTRRMMERAVDLEVTVTATEVEALILECNLIKELRPRYNVMLRDDKSYPFIKVTVQEEWPRVYFTRSVVKDGARYFGPFTDSKSVRETLDTLNRLFPFRTCHRTITGKDPRACLLYHIHRCTAPCIGVADHDEYMQSIQQVVLFLEGKQEQIIDQMRKDMDLAAEDLRFEHAARLRDRIRSLERIIERQRITSIASGDELADRDVIGMVRSDSHACAQLFFVRGGKLVRSEHFVLDGTEDETTGPVLSTFLQQFYDTAAYVPPEILVQEELEDVETIAQWLSGKRGTRVRLVAPKRGQKQQLINLALENARQQLEMLKLRWLNDTQRTTAAIVELRDALQIPTTPHRIECYDISNIQGTSAVGSMVVFEGGQPKNSEYRRFKIKTVEGANDFAMLQEVLRRRFKRAVAGQQPAISEDEESEGVGEGVRESGRAGGREDMALEPAPDEEVVVMAGASAGSAGVSPASLPLPQEDLAVASVAPRPEQGGGGEGGPDEHGTDVGGGAQGPYLLPGDALQDRPNDDTSQDPALSTQDPLSPQSSALGPDDQSPDPGPLAPETGWAAMPDLVIVDGGKGQLNAALEVMDELGLAELPVVGLAKENEEIFQPGARVGLMLPRNSQALFLVQRIRDEAHRFAITYHRKVRTKKGFASALDEVQGIGPKRKQALIKHFGSVRAIREASLEELLAVPGMDRRAAAKLKEHL